MTVAFMSTGPNLVPVLVETTGVHRGREHAMPYGEHILGRGRGATVALDDPDVSRQHARIVVEPEGLTIFDLGSKNGLRVDGRRIHDAVTLGHGDELTVGEITLRLQHPAAQVAQALAAAGEATVTITNTKDEREAPMMGLLWPVVGVLVFGTAVVALLLV
ncbi:MAG: FHA domain-containing protein [bacterium]|nr:FHA domain-containing protein [bacterium]